MFDFITGYFNRDKGYNPLPKAIVRSYNKSRPEGKKEKLCYVPFSSLTFSWEGKIYACTYNRNILVGQYPNDTLEEVWHGERLKKLQDHISHNDLNYGCQHCKYFLEKEKFSGLKPHSFDKYSNYKKVPYPQVMEFELSNQCNLECVMCNGYVSSAIRQNQDKLPPVHSPYDQNFVTQLRPFIPYLKEAKFFGGEPFLIPVYFKLWDAIMELNPAVEIFVITNGTMLTDKIKTLLQQGKFDLAVSIDSIRKERYETIRKNADFDTVMRNLEYFNSYALGRGKHLSLSFTSQLSNWDEIPEVIAFCNARDIVFFNSYLTAPKALAIIFQPSEKLRAMWEYLSGFQLPERTEIEKQNKRCFEDYLRYLLFYEEKNKNGIDYKEQKDTYFVAE
jgi:radical SAM protein with 4Fe4S-binding SPASM domain